MELLTALENITEANKKKKKKKKRYLLKKRN